MDFSQFSHTKFKNGIIINADCLDVMKVMKEQGIKADLCLTDPPYGINAPNMKSLGIHPNSGTAERLKNNRLQRLNGGGGKLKDRLLNNSQINWDYSTPSDEIFNYIFLLSDNQIIWGGNYFGLPPTRCILAWDKMQPWVNFSQFELAWTSFDNPARLYRIDKSDGAVIEQKIHPTQKPLKLFAIVLNEFSKENDLILDSFAGSMTTAVACIKTNRRFICVEKDAEYYAKGIDRVKQFDDFNAYKLF